MQTALREGFTTGTAAAAAAFAAVSLLLAAAKPDCVPVALPPFVCSEDGPRQTRQDHPRLLIPIEDGASSGDGTAWASVVKDGGDDPDATHGARILVHAGYEAPGGTPLSRAVYVPCQLISVTLYGGAGVGTVTLPGLPVAVGEPAINPEPRKQIAFAAVEAARRHGYAGSLHLCVSVPDGEKRARRTMNARLGILGGISILGTQGTVRPYSHEAWKAAISQGLSVASAMGLRTILFSTGRRSERLGFALHPELGQQAGVQVADYAAHAVRTAAGHGFSRLIWACFPGKLLKLAQGLEWTHAQSAGADIALLARYCIDAGGDDGLARAVAAMPTAAGAFALLAGQPDLHDSVLRRVGTRARDALWNWLLEAHAESGTACPELLLHVFSLDKETLLLTFGADARNP